MLGCCAVSAPASAAVLFSLTGTVGDANWGAANFTEPNYELALNLSSYFQHNGGPGGKLEITYTGAPILASFDQLFHDTAHEDYLCLDTSGCADRSDFLHLSGDENVTPQDFPGPDGATTYTDIIDSNFYFEPGMPPPDAPYAYLFEDRWDGNVGFTLDDLVSTDYAGRAFSITVSAVPEPASWSLMIAGFGLTGFMLRRRKSAFSRT